MPKGVYPHRSKAVCRESPLSEEERQQVAQWLGEFIPPARIPELVADRFGKRVAPAYAYKLLTRKKWSLLIDRYRQQWLVNVLEVPLANKKVRLSKLQRLATNLEGNEAHVAPRDFEGRMLRILESARLEMDEKTGDQTTVLFAQINQCTDEELLQRRADLLKRIQEFRWPTTRRLTDGMGRSEGGTATGSPASEDGGRDGSVRDDTDHGTVEGETAER